MASIKPIYKKVSGKETSEITSYRFRACMGRDEYGKQIFISKNMKVEGKYSEMTPKQLEKAMQLLADNWEDTERDNRRKEIQRAGDRDKFETFVKTTWWNSHVLHNKRGELSQLTIDFYKIITSQILASKHFKDKNLVDITTRNIDSYINDLRDSGVSVSTVKHHRDVLNIIFTYAYDKDYIERNPMRKADPIITERKPVTRLSANEYDDFMTALDEHADLEHRLMMRIMLQMGLRRGECAGLRWKDIDSDKKTMNIHTNIVYSSQLGVVEKNPKSMTSKRVLPIPQDLMPAIAEWRQEQQNKLNMKILANAFLFPNEANAYEPQNPQNITRWLSRFTARYNLGHIHPHMLRHTFGSMAIANEGNLVAVSRYMGHSDTKTTAQSYVELDTEDLRQVSDIIDSISAG